MLPSLFMKLGMNVIDYKYDNWQVQCLPEDGARISVLIYTVITAIGGGFDLVYMFRELKRKNVDETDNGRVQ